MVYSNSGLSNRFTIESHLLSTRSADASKAIDRERGVGVCLWTLRHPLPHNSDAVQRFMSRMVKMRDLEPAVAAIDTFGIDPSGIAFAVMPTLDGAVVDSGNLEAAEAERRFISALRLIEQLHGVGLVCGDLCSSSFLVGRGGEVRFIGVMGSFDSEAAATAMLPPMETLNFIAPEQRAGGGLEPASDVFALGVLGYRLLTGAYPYPAGSAMFTGEFNQDQIKPISAFNPSAPVWAEEVIMHCLRESPNTRYANAGEAMRAIFDIRRQLEAGERSLAHTQGNADARNVRSRRPTRGSLRPQKALEPRRSEPRNSSVGQREQAAAPNRSRRVLAIVLGLLLVASLTAVFLMVRAPRHADISRDPALDPLIPITRDTNIGNTVPQISQANRGVGGADQEKLRSQFDALSKSNDPAAHEALVRLAKRATVRDARDLAESALLDRARRLGLQRTAEQVRQWLRTVKDETLPAAYEPVLRSLDSTLPLEARSKTLTQAYASNPKLALRLAASLALDSEDSEVYRPLLSQLMLDQTRNSELSGKSIYTLILSEPDLALIYEDDVLKQKDKIPEKDTLTVLKLFAERSDQAARAIANLAIERNLLSPLRKSLLLLVRDRTDLPVEIQSSIIHAAAGVITPNDVANLGRWYDPQSEKVLLAIMAESTDKAMLTEAFDTLAGKTPRTEPSATILGWVRQKQWDSRADFAQVVGILGNLDVLGEEALKGSEAVFDKAAKDRSFVDLLLHSPDPRLVRLAIDRYRDQLGIGGLVNLLDNGDPEVRMTAVRSLKDVNEIAVLKIILDKYDAEKDPSVRKAYQESFWMIKGREDRK